MLHFQLVVLRIVEQLDIHSGQMGMAICISAEQAGPNHRSICVCPDSCFPCISVVNDEEVNI